MIGVFCAMSAIASACVVENNAPTYVPPPPRRVVDAAAPVPAEAGNVAAAVPALIEAGAILENPTAPD